MTKKYFYLAIFFLLIFIIFWLVDSNKKPPRTVCENKNYEIPLSLKSGEKGILRFKGNDCELSSRPQGDDLSFRVLADGALEDSFYQSRFYIWSRDNNLTAENNIKQILSKYEKDRFCLVVKNDYLQRDGLLGYRLESIDKPSDYCLLLGAGSDLVGETFLVLDQLIVMHRQDGLDGIAPFDLASIEFLGN